MPSGVQVYVEPSQIGWLPLKDSWMATLPPSLKVSLGKATAETEALWCIAEANAQRQNEPSSHG